MYTTVIFQLQTVASSNLSTIHPCIQELFLRGENLLSFGYNLTCFGKKVFNSEKLMLIESGVKFRVVSDRKCGVKLKVVFNAHVPGQKL